MFIYAVYDRVAGLFGDLRLFKREELAVRQFDYLMLNAPMVACDCELYRLGDYDELTGEIVSYKPVFVKKYEVKSNG